MDYIIRKLHALLCSKCRGKIRSLRLRRTPKTITAQKVDSLVSYLEIVNRVSVRLRVELNDVIAYRGHRKVEYELKPYLFRKDYEKLREKEAELLRQIEVAYPEEFSGMTTLDKLVKLQHYGFPTRLLDVTLNPLVALYFAAKDDDQNNTDGAVVVCRVPDEAVKVFDNDVAASIANLANLSADMKKILSYCPSDYELREDQQGNEWINFEDKKAKKSNSSPSESSTRVDTSIANPEEVNPIFSKNLVPNGFKLNTHAVNSAGYPKNSSAECTASEQYAYRGIESSLKKVMRKFIRFIKYDLPYYEESLTYHDILNPVYVKPKQLNRRIIAQNGAFLLFGMAKDRSDFFTQEKIIISGSAKKKILSELDAIGISEHVLFPELDKFLAHIRREKC